MDFIYRDVVCPCSYVVGVNVTDSCSALSGDCSGIQRSNWWTCPYWLLIWMPNWHGSLMVSCLHTNFLARPMKTHAYLFLLVFVKSRLHGVCNENSLAPLIGYLGLRLYRTSDDNSVLYDHDLERYLLSRILKFIFHVSSCSCISLCSLIPLQLCSLWQRWQSGPKGDRR